MAISKFYNKNFKSLNNSEKFYEEMLNLTIEKVFEEGLRIFSTIFKEFIYPRHYY